MISKLKSSNSLLLTLLLIGSLILVLSAQFVAADDVLRVRNRLGQDITSMDPAHYTGPEYAIDLAVFAKLMRFKPGSSELELDAAKSIEVNDDSTEIHFVLREGIQFHHGYGEMTAEDVKFSFERIIDPATASEYAADWRTLDRVEVTGRYSGVIYLNEPLASLFVGTIPYTPGSIISKKAYEDLGGRFATNPVGAGPYYWQSWIPGQKITLARFDDYFGQPGDFAKIELFPIVELEIAELAFDRGDLDATEISLDSYDRYAANPNVEIHTLSTLRYHWVGFNQEHPPFDNVLVREAVRYAVDVDSIIAGAFNNIPQRNNSMLAPGILGYWEDAPHYEVDLDKARALLAEAGYPDGFRTQITTDSTSVHVNAAQIVQQQLRAIGIDASINMVEAGAGYETMGRGSPEGMHYQSFSAILDPGYWFEWFTTDQVGFWNYWKWSNPEFDRLKALGDVTTDFEAREQIYIEMAKLIDQDVTCIWVTNGASIYVSRPGVNPEFLAHYPQYHYWNKD